MLLGVVFVGGGVSLKQAAKLIEPTDLPPASSFGPIPAFAFLASIAAMAVEILLWVALANYYMPNVLHARVGGFLGVTAFASCAGSAIFLLWSATMALRAAASNYDQSK